MRNSLALACILVLAGGCRPPEELAPPPSPYDPYGGYQAPPEATGLYIDPHAASVVTAAHAPPPISGGTLGVSADGHMIVAADPDRDRILLVDVTTSTPTVTPVALPAGAEPGRVAIDDANHLAHVVLRGSGEVASVELTAGPRITRRRVCATPRGIDVDASRSLVRVACRDGEIVSFDPTSTNAPSTLQTNLDDLRDLIVRGDELVVTRFRSAEVIRLDAASGAEIARAIPISSTSPTTVRTDGSPAEFRPSVAWRAIPVGDDIFLSHQRSSDGELSLAPGAYYSTGVCSGSIVQSAATIFRGPTLTPVESPNIAGVTLPVDIARNPMNGEIAIVGAGIESTQFQPSVARVQPADLEYDSATDGSVYGGGCINQTYGAGYGYGYGSPPAGAEQTPNAIAVAYLPDGRLVVQGREPAQLRIEGLVIALGGGSVFDTGHAFFHGDAGRGTACASCHPEAGDDGRTWSFADLGPRRTPAVPAGFLTTAPFHWSGDLPDLSHLMGTVFTERMGGPTVDAAHTTAIGSWLDTRPSDAPRVAHGDAVTRGAAVFQDAGCASCHSGAMLTNNLTVDVGTGGAFQVPSLVGVSRALPVMHDGCAQTLRDRFDPACGGNAHGTIASVDDPRVDDLVAYLQTL